MRVQQELTTDEVAVLEIMKCLTDEEYMDNEKMRLLSISEKMEAFSWDCLSLSEQEVFHYLDILQYYNYLEEDYAISCEGRQYLYLVKEYLELEKNQKNRNVIVPKFTLLNIEKLGLIFERTLDAGSIFGEIFAGIKEIVSGK